MGESFAQLFEESLSSIDMRPGAIFEGRVFQINKETGYVIIETPLKSESYIKIEEFMDPEGNLEIAEGDTVAVALEAIEDGWGETRLSRLRAKRQEAWKSLESAYQKGDAIMGIICGKVKGGFTVDIAGIRAFLPGSLVDVRPVRDTTNLEGRALEFKVIKLDQKRNNVVVSRRQVIESENTVERESLLSNLQENMIVKGVVKNLTDYGAFVDLGGIDGLLHITDISWKRVKHPAEILKVGEEVEVRILRFDKERMRVSLGLKQLGEDPWVGVARRYPQNARIRGRVTNIADYGCFVELEEGIEGLVHVSEMDWTNRNIHPSKVVQAGEEVEVMVLDIDEERRRISLGLKQCKDSPWKAFSDKFNKGDKINGKIRSITDFGLFVGLEGGIDGLVHLSDLSWSQPGEEAVRAFKKGDEIEAVVLSVDPERERISLGVKQMQSDPHSDYLTENQKGCIVTGVIKEVDAKGAMVELSDGVEGYLRITEVSRDRMDDTRPNLQVGQAIEAKIIGVDRKTRVIQLSIKAKETEEEAAALRTYARQDEENASTGTTLGDLLKKHMQSGSDEND